MARSLRVTPSHMVRLKRALAEEMRDAVDWMAPLDGSSVFIRHALMRYWDAGMALSVAPAWWVSAEMEALSLCAAEDRVPIVEPGTPDGFLAFERSLPEEVAPGLPRVRAVQWFRSASGLGYVYFTSEGCGDGLPLRVVDVGPGQDASGVRHLMDAVWALSSEPRVCEQVDGRGSSDEGLWAGSPPDPMCATDRDVKFLVLRENRTSPFGSDEGRSRREPSHRFVVRGHWRNQACGPNHSQRRMQWIPPYVKGPADAPLVVRETVRIWRR